MLGEGTWIKICEKKKKITGYEDTMVTCVRLFTGQWWEKERKQLNKKKKNAFQVQLVSPVPPNLEMKLEKKLQLSITMFICLKKKKNVPTFDLIDWNHLQQNMHILKLNVFSPGKMKNKEQIFILLFVFLI